MRDVLDFGILLVCERLVALFEVLIHIPEASSGIKEVKLFMLELSLTMVFVDCFLWDGCFILGFVRGIRLFACRPN